MQDYLTILCEELLLPILDFIDPISLINLSRTSKYLLNITKTKTKLKEWDLIYSPSQLNTLDIYDLFCIAFNSKSVWICDFWIGFENLISYENICAKFEEACYYGMLDMAKCLSVPLNKIKTHNPLSLLNHERDKFATPLGLFYLEGVTNFNIHIDRMYHNTQNKSFIYALDYACKSGNLDIAKWIYEVFGPTDINLSKISDKVFIDLLTLNISSDYKINIGEWLLNLDGSVIKSDLSDGFMSATYFDDLLLAEWIISIQTRYPQIPNKINIYIRDKKAFNDACFRGSYQIVNMLLELDHNNKFFDNESDCIKFFISACTSGCIKTAELVHNKITNLDFNINIWCNADVYDFKDRYSNNLFRMYCSKSDIYDLSWLCQISDVYDGQHDDLYDQNKIIHIELKLVIELFTEALVKNEIHNASILYNIISSFCQVDIHIKKVFRSVCLNDSIDSLKWIILNISIKSLDDQIEELLIELCCAVIIEKVQFDIINCLIDYVDLNTIYLSQYSAEKIFYNNLKRKNMLGVDKMLKIMRSSGYYMSKYTEDKINKRIPEYLRIICPDVYINL